MTVSIDPERIKEFEKKNKDNEAGRMVRNYSLKCLRTRRYSVR